MRTIAWSFFIAVCTVSANLAGADYPFPGQSGAVVLPGRSDTCATVQREQNGIAGAALGGITGLLMSRGKAEYGLAGALVGGVIGAHHGTHAAHHARYRQSQDELYADWMCRHYNPCRHHEFVSCVHYSSLPYEWKRRIICHFNGLYDRYTQQSHDSYPY